MKHSCLLKVAPVLAVVLALVSTPAHGGTVIQFRGGNTSTEKNLVAQGTIAQSKQQEGSVTSDSSATGAARRERKGSFIKRVAEGIKNLVNPVAPIVEETVAAIDDYEVAAQIVDAGTFIRPSVAAGLIEPDFHKHVTESILESRDSDLKTKTHALVDELAEKDEGALHALLYLSIYYTASDVVRVRPKLRTALYRLEARLKADDFSFNFRKEWYGWGLHRDIALMVLSAPGARSLLHKLTDSEVQQEARDELAEKRASILNVENARQSIEKAQTLRNHIVEVYKSAGIKFSESKGFLNTLKYNSRTIADEGVTLVFDDNKFPTAIQTGHGSFIHRVRIDSNQSFVLQRLYHRLIQDLGLVRISGEPRNVFAVTRLPDGKVLPVARRVYEAPVSRTELRKVLLQVPEEERHGIRIDPR